MVVPILVASHIIDPLDLEILSGLTGGVVGVGRRWFTASYSLLMKSLIGPDLSQYTPHWVLS